MKEIQLTQGKVSIVDDEIFDELNRHKWFARPNGFGKFYAARSSGKEDNYEIVLMHRYILNTPKGMVGDHINGNTLDNRKSNLRNTTYSQNSMNRKANKTNISGMKNITITKYGTYSVIIGIKRKCVFYKTFKSLEEAIKAREEALNKYHGEFARTK